MANTLESHAIDPSIMDTASNHSISIVPDVVDTTIPSVMKKIMKKRHFVDQKFKALSIWNYLGHIVIICALVGGVIAVRIIFRENMPLSSSSNFFVPHFTYTYDMWLTIGVNGLSIIWMFILFLV